MRPLGRRGIVSAGCLARQWCWRAGGAVVCVLLESRQCFSVVSGGGCFAGEVGLVNIHRFMPCCLQVVSAALVLVVLGSAALA
jgi:hypothetical protein